MRNSLINSTRTDGSITEPVTLTEVKPQCIVDVSFTADDTLLTNLITRCRAEAEEYCNISIVDKSVVANALLYCEQRFHLPYGPVKAITSVQAKNNSSGVATYDTLATTDYTVLNSEIISTRNGEHQITYTVGMTAVPAALKAAILNLIAFRYENRGDAAKEPSMTMFNPFIDMSWI